MENSLPLIHRIVVSLFLLIYLVKTLLLFLNKSEQLKRFTKLVKVPEMIISALFLITGIWLVSNISANSKVSMLYYNLIIIKIILVVSSIPIAIIGFKKGKKVLAMVSLLLIILSYGLGEMAKNIRENGDEQDRNSINSGEISIKNRENGNGQEIKPFNPKEEYENKCSRCHGFNGKLMMGGASDLSVSAISRDSVITVISKGRKNMMAYGSSYSNEKIEKLAAYIETLKGK